MLTARKIERRMIRKAVISILILVLFSSAVSWASLKPSFTVKDFYAAVNAGDYNKAESYFTEEFRASFINDGVDHFVRQMKDYVAPGSVIDVRVENEKIQQSKAEVIIKLIYNKDGKVESGRQKFTLIRQREIWKIDKVSEA